MLQTVVVPDSLAAAQTALADHGRAVILGGGTAVMPILNAGTDEFDVLVSLRNAGLATISVSDGKVAIGAAATLSDLTKVEALAFLRPALETIASPTIRNMATVGGNLFVKQPYGDLTACLIALGATATIAGPAGTRIEPVETLVASGAAAGEVVTQLSFALPAAGSFKFTKAGRKALNAAAIVTVAAVAVVKDGSVSDCRVGLGGVARYAVRAVSVEKALVGKPFDRASVETAAAEAVNDIDPSDDSYASAWYRARVTPVHIRRALLGE